MAVPEKRCDNQETFRIVPVSEIPKAAPVEYPPAQLYKIFVKMEAVCNELNGIGLHAVQIGLPLNMHVIKRLGVFEHYLNCKYQPLSEEKITSCEGCLSITAANTPRYFALERYTAIRVTGQQLLSVGKLKIDNIDNVLTTEQDGVFCIAQQHEIDHSSSILISDIGTEQHIWDMKEC